MINATKYFIVFMAVLIILVFASNAIISFDLVGNPDNKGINIMIILLLIVTIITITGVSLSYTIQPTAKYIMPPIGDRGIKGNRGNKGEKSTCGLKCSDDSCYMKVMNHITRVYNIWCHLDSSNRDPIPGQNHIDNLFIKKKVKEICQSRIFSELLKNHGEKKPECTVSNINNGKCGAYDYILQKWTEWILIILKYENGKLFLDTETLTDNNFNAMLTENDLKPSSFTEWTFPFSNKQWFKRLEHQTNDPEDSHFNDYWGPNNYGVPSAKDKSSVHDLKSPFEEIQMYDAWYWGANPLSVPKIINKSITEDSNIKPIKGNIKIRLSNDYNHLWNSGKAKQVKKQLIYNEAKVDTYVPRQPKGQIYKNGSSLSAGSVDVYRARDFYDNGEKDTRFKSYKPIGDVMLIHEEDDSNNKTNSKECYPRYLKSDYIQLGSNLNKSPKAITLLVSGDTKKPTGYTLITSFSREVGFNAHKLAYSFWRPIAPKGYVALGDIISTSPNSEEPSTDLIRCIPDSCTTQFTSELKQIYTFQDPLGSSDTGTQRGRGNIIQSNKDITSEIPETLEGNENKKNKELNTLSNEKVVPFLKHYNVFRLKGQRDDTFYSINEASIYDDSYVYNSKINTITKKKHGMDYSILNIYNK
jgi:hypothetical protein